MKYRLSRSLQTNARVEFRAFSTSTRYFGYSFHAALLKASSFRALGALNDTATNAKMSTMRTTTFILARVAVLMALPSTASAQVVDQPYRISDREVAQLLDR